MKILIGTPIHEIKDYSMEKWLESVSKFDYPADLLMVDNSPSINYVKRVRGYCKKYGINNYKLIHINVNQDSILDERLSQSREVIRQEILTKEYDAWCSIECDVIAPPNAITKLVDLIRRYWMVSHVYPSRVYSNKNNAEFGIALIKRRALEKLGFLKGYGNIDPLEPTCWYGNDVWFIKQLDDKSNGKRRVVHEKIYPIYHLNK